MSKKLLSLALALVMCMSLCIPAWAMDTNDPNEASVPNTVTVVDCRNMSEAQREQAFQAFKRKITGTTDVPRLRANLGYSYTKWAKNVEKDAVGWPGRQNPQGYSFSDGGDLFFTSDGGPQVSLSISVDLPGSPFSVGISLGNMTNGRTLNLCHIPASPRNNPVWYKILETKTVSVRPYVTYWRQTKLDPWTVASSGQYVQVMSTRSDAIRVYHS